MKAMYGRIEHRYCEPVAEALASDRTFAQFFMERANIKGWGEAFRCLKDEQENLRKSARFWWKNVFCPESRCQCPNLRGREVDILAVFERLDGVRLGMHIECKHPKDIFSEGQAERYRERLSCWTKSERGPPTIPAHEEAVAILICDRANNRSASDLAQFDAIIFFDEIAARIAEYPMAEV
ncbi:hypothetical protein [Hyphomonas sp. GM-8P]|uniref:hypothetical protein n=1 Tax=Hyphomonas sp. GM-8P TaxID=1280945 RepID=UPI0011BDB7E5|nr:hypothetical protein [Hyphomonas sp. GM-8P]